MVVYYGLSHPGLAEIRRIPLAAHLFIEEFLRKGAVLLPPGAKGGGIVGSGRADAEIGIAGRLGKIFRRVFRHSLDLEAEDVQLVHHRGDAGRNHSEVLAAGEHSRGAEQGGQFAKCALAPEVVVAMVEEILIEGPETIFLPLFELPESLAVPGVDTRMVPALLAGILDEELTLRIETHPPEFVAAVREGR